MIHRFVQSAAAKDPARPFLVAAEREVPYAEAAEAVARIAGGFLVRGLSRIGIYMANSPTLVLTLLGAVRAGVEPCVINHESSRDEVDEILSRLELSHLVVDEPLGVRNAEEIPSRELPNVPAASEPPADAGILILTTGTTGVPKAARYVWSDLAAQVRTRDDQATSRWLLGYNLNHFGGVQMLMHVLVNGATLVLPSSLRPSDAISAIESHGVTHVSATPTFWRMVKVQIAPERLRALPLRHVTLGAEAASKDLLDDLRGWFPDARIVHIFAATEVGSCFSVDDGRDGVPASILDRGDDAGVQFEIRDGELFIRSRHGMTGYYGEAAAATDGWRSTGDLVEQRGDRIYFVGRKSERINVGGVKVDPLPVEERVQRVPEVALVRVYGKPNAITGQVVAVDVMVVPNADRSAVERSIREACRDLPPQARPRLIRFVDQLETRNSKLARRAS
ncbi:MAG: class I adenylate-forming enzyme family protein [Candidatus Binatia bacterium]